MNNPYRARPIRSRVAQSKIPPIDPIQHQQPIGFQSKQSTDPWNNSWNWDFDKQGTDNQQQQQQLQQQEQQQQQQQQQHYAPPYTNQGQFISNSVQDHYYQNINGNKSDLLNQNLMVDRNTPATTANRPPTSNHSDSFTPYSNYNQYQQYAPPPPTQPPSQPPSAKSGSTNFDQPQWTVEQSKNIPYGQVANTQSRKDQAPRPALVGSNHNWPKPDQTNLTGPHNWQSHSNVSGHVQYPKVDKEPHVFDDTGNQHAPLQQTRSNQPPLTSIENREHSINEANSWSNQVNASSTAQWNSQNRESVLSNQSQQPTQSYNVNNEFNSWSQTGNVDALQQWKHPDDTHSSKWLSEQQENNNLSEESIKQDNTAAGTINDWQQNQTVPHILPAVIPTTESNTEDERKRSVPSTDISAYSKTNVVKAHPLDSHANTSTTPETMSTVASSENVSMQENNDFNLAGESLEWRTNNAVEELPAKVEQLNLGTKLNKHLENQNESKEVHPVAISEDAWNQNTASRNSSTPDNVPGLPSDYASHGTEASHSNENQTIVAKEHPALNTYQMANIKPMDNVAQGGYDQWYSQAALSLPSENAWYSKDHCPPKEWATEQNVENYENIQQPAEFVNLEVVAPSLQKRDIYGSRDSINKETLDNDPKPVVNPVKEAANARDFRQEVNNIEVPSAQQSTRSHTLLQSEQVPDNYEFATNDRNTFLETGELTDSHQEHEPTPPNQEDENDEVPNDIPFLREVPGQSSSIDPRRNDPTGQEQYVQSGQRLSDPRRNDPSGQEQGLQLRSISDRSERRDVPPGQERNVPLLSRSDSDTMERRNDPSGRERSLPPQQSRNDPSGEERHQSQPQLMLEPSETREIPGRGNEPEDPAQQTDENLRQIPGATMQDQTNDSRTKREEAVGASIRESQGATSSSNRRDSYEDEDEDDEGSANSRDDSRERRHDSRHDSRRDSSSERRRYEYERKTVYSDREREYDDDYYYDRRRGGENERSYSARDEFDRREIPYREDDRKHHSRDDLDRHSREEIERRSRGKDDLDERDGRRRPEDRRKERDDIRRRDREIRDYDSRYSRDRDYMDRDRRRDDRRPRRYDDYDIRDPYRREYYDDPYARGSRPSSRSSYNDRDREYYMRARDPYYGYNGYPGYDYGAHYASNYYAYIENLRRTNPAAYSEWYHKYYASQHHHQQQHISRGVANYPEDRASVHSGRSSCDDRFFTNPSACFHSPNKALYVPYFGYHGWTRSPRRRQNSSYQNSHRTAGDKCTIGDMSIIDDSISTPARMTPSKFSISHAYGCFSIGSLIHVHPAYPAEGERAKVDIVRLDNLLAHDPVARDLRVYPGPLIKGVTHKKTIIEYCENKIKKAATNEEIADRASYILLYELMIMLIQQNGNVVGVDIAALLLRNKDAYPYEANKPKDSGRRESVISQRSGIAVGDNIQSNQDGATVSEKVESKPQKTVEQITDEFRNTLLYGLVQEALEYAMNEGLWGHALFLASKLDKRTHASVMTRFANSLPIHDPLQTLYQLHSGRVPTVVTAISDPRWDDWRPHLAMIISNTSANPEINRRSITTLGDTLSARGDIHAAHFCYILAQVDFGAYGMNNAKLVLIGANHHKPYNTFLSTEAVMLTEIYEYARNLSEPGFTLANLQTFKFDLAVKMVDHGLIEKALLYIEQITINIVNEPSKYKRSFINEVYNLGDKIRYHDPIYKDSIDEATTLTWFNNLAEIVGKCRSGEIIENESSQAKPDSYNAVQSHEVQQQQQSQQQLQQQLQQQQQQQQQWSTIQSDYREGSTSMMMMVTTNDIQSDWQPSSLPANMPEAYDQSMQRARTNEESINQYQQPQQQDYWNQDSYYQNNYENNDSTVANWQQQSTHASYPSEQGDVDNSQQQDKWNYETEREEKTPTPEVSNYTLTADSNLDAEWSLDDTNVSSLRRRRILTGSDVASHSSDSNTNSIATGTSSISNPYRSTNSDEKSMKCRKLVNYPKIDASYPKILPNDQIHTKDTKRVKKIDGRYIKPPSTQPPVFLKCKVKRKVEESRKLSNEIEDNIFPASTTTDLDIQFSKVKFQSLSKFDSNSENEMELTDSETKSQTLKQYCNFEDKEVTRVAPHIRRKDVICDTVDAWSCSNSSNRSTELCRYKPLVFGGTYPIDLPVRPTTDLCLTDFERVPNESSIPKTYDIDVPTNCE